jgi:hypothetical protein
VELCDADGWASGAAAATGAGAGVTRHAASPAIRRPLGEVGRWFPVL